MEELFWADQIANNIINRKKYNHIDKKIKNPKTLTIKSSTSISGVPHIGNASDILRHEAVVKALKDKGQKVRFIWVAEDMDPWRKVPEGIPKSFSKYIGIPVSALPCPNGCCKDYTQHFVNLFLGSLKDHFDTTPEFLSTTESYKKGVFYNEIKKSLEKIEEVKEILSKFRKQPLPKDYSIWKPVCDNCGKIITTNITDVRKDGVEYVCEDYSFKEFGKKAYNVVKGCGHKGFSNIKKGNGKLLWSVEWAAEWSAWKVVLEGAGKEHFMPTSPFWRAGEICEKIFDWPEPYPGKNPIQPYEYVTVGGEKMSASKGNTVATWEWSEFAPPETLKLLFLKKPNKQRDFRYSEIFRLVDEMDKLEAIYFGKEKIADKKERSHNKRLFELSSIKLPKKYRNPISFTFLATLSQIYNEFSEAKKVLERLDHEIVDEKFIKERFERSKVWLNKYAPGEMKFELQKSVSSEVKEKLSEKQKKAIKLLNERLKKKKFKEKELFEEFYNISKEVELETKDFFKAAYLILLKKERGPRLAPFILTLGEKATNLFSKI